MMGGPTSSVVLGVLAASLAGPCASAREAGVVTALIENDSFSTQDRNYTNGLKFAYVTPWNEEDRLTQKVMQWFWPGKVDRQHIRLRSAFGIGQSMFTPDDITAAAPLPGQRPYAGWLYGFSGFSAENASDPLAEVRTSVEVELGIVGPSAGAKWVQTNFHERINGAEPRGWDNQLKDEPGIAVTVERAIRYKSQADETHGGIDFIPDFGVSVGNVRTEAFAGATLHVGTDLDNTPLPMRVRPSLSGSGAFSYGRSAPSWAWSAFVGVYGRAVAHNIFLDGNTFRDSLSVPKKTWVADGQAGVELRFGRLLFSYTYVLRGEEYKGQNGNSRFGAVGLSVHL